MYVDMYKIRMKGLYIIILSYKYIHIYNKITLLLYNFISISLIMNNDINRNNEINKK